MNIRIVTDSTSDLPDEIAEEFSILVVRNLLVLDGASYTDGIEISRKSFYDQLPHLKQPPTTATASAGTYLKIYTDLINQGADKILSIHPSINLTGIYNAANAAAIQLDERVLVVDSRQISLGLGFQVLEAAKAAQLNKSIDYILNLIDSIRQRTRVVAMLDTLEYVQHSGRVSWAKARLASFLNLRPFIELHNGELLSLGEARTRSKGIVRLGKILEETGPLERLAILHTNAYPEAETLKKQYAERSLNPAWISNVTTVIGTHVGPNALGFVAIRAG